MTVILNSDNYQSLLEQVIHVNSPNELPIITISLHRPTITFNFLLLLLIATLASPIMLTVLLKLTKEPLLIFSDNLRDFLILTFFFCFIIFSAFVEYKTIQLKIFNQTKINNYFCKLTPQYIEWVFNEQKRQIAWRNIILVDKFMTYKMRTAHVWIQIDKDDDMLIYDNHLNINYRKVWQLIHNYHIKALGKNIITIK